LDGERVDTPTSDDLLAELAAFLAPPPEDAITVKMLMERTGCSRYVCRELLEKQLLRGELESRYWDNNKWYWKKEGK
jgi:hypothetical protein